MADVDPELRALWAAVPPRDEILALIPPSARRVLDVGAGAGATALALRERGHDVVAIENHPVSVDIVRERLGPDALLDIDAETLTLSSFEPDSFDVVVFADVLEHLRDPASLVTYAAAWAPLAIASLPNGTHYSIIRMLLSGRWDFEQHGLRDATHLRWFGRDNMKELFEHAGYRDVEVSGKFGLTFLTRWREPGFLIVARR